MASGSPTSSTAGPTSSPTATPMAGPTSSPTATPTAGPTATPTAACLLPASCCCCCCCCLLLPAGHSDCDAHCHGRPDCYADGWPDGHSDCDAHGWPGGHSDCCLPACLLPPACLPLPASCCLPAACCRNFPPRLKWQVSIVTDMTSMFWAASSFDGDLSSWDVRLFRLGRERAWSMNNNPSLLGVPATLLNLNGRSRASRT
jgi:hypothetical protein